MSRKLSPLYTLYKEPFKQRYISTRRLNKRLANNEQRPRVRGWNYERVVLFVLARKVAENRGAGSFPSSSNIDRSTTKGEKKEKKRRKDLERLAIAFNLGIGSRRSNFERDGFPHFTLYYPVRVRIYIYGTPVIRRLSWDFVPLFESSFEFSFKTWLNLWFWKGRGEEDWFVS